MNSPRLRILATALSLAAGTGCNPQEEWERRQADPELQAIARRLEARAESLAIQDTVAGVAYLQGLQPVRVVGYGIVVGLGDQGSSECPPDIRNVLVQEMRKRHHLGSESRGLRELHPAELLDDPDTAVVQVTADIPGGVLSGTTLNATVTALPGTQTRSLRGGYLWRCDLKRVRAAGGDTVIQGKILGYAEGPVFVCNFDDKGSPLETVNPRVGSLLGTVRVTDDRDIRLEIRDPSFQTAVLVARKINERFPATDKVADASSPGTVQLRIPTEHLGRESEFLALLMHVYLRETPGFLEERTQELAVEILDPDAPHDDIGLAWESIGRRTLPEVRKLYGDRRAHVNFFAARTGLRMNDVDAVMVLRRHAYDLSSPFAHDAIRELGNAGHLSEAAAVLRPLLDHENDHVRIQAYLALRRRMDRYIKSVPVGDPNFTVDLVDSKGPPLIYARTGGAQCLAIIGDVARCRPPIFYEHPDRLFGLHAGEDADHVTLLRLSPNGQMLIPPITVGLEVEELVLRMGAEMSGGPGGEFEGANLPYSEIIQTLYDLTAAGVINARFELETPEDRVRTGALEPPGRAETDLKD